MKRDRILLFLAIFSIVTFFVIPYGMGIIIKNIIITRINESNIKNKSKEIYYPFQITIKEFSTGIYKTYAILEIKDRDDAINSKNINSNYKVLNISNKNIHSINLEVRFDNRMQSSDVVKIFSNVILPRYNFYKDYTFAF